MGKEEGRSLGPLIVPITSMRLLIVIRALLRTAGNVTAHSANFTPRTCTGPTPDLYPPYIHLPRTPFHNRGVWTFALALDDIPSWQGRKAQTAALGTWGDSIKSFGENRLRVRPSARGRAQSKTGPEGKKGKKGKKGKTDA